MPTYSDAMAAYITNTFAVEDEILSHIREQIPIRGLPAINIRPEEGQFLQFLAASCKAALALEIGTLGGYSGTWVARGLKEGGRLITLEKEPHHANVAREHFKYAEVDGMVEVREGDAQDLLVDLEAEGPFDFIFIDAEKEGYPGYLDWSLENMRPGSVISAHNAFRHGRILDLEDNAPGVKAMREFNTRMASDPRLVSTIFPAGDGIMIGVYV